MGKILFISQRIEKIQQYSRIFAQKPYEFVTSSEDFSVMEILDADNPDVIIFDDAMPSIKSTLKKIKSVVPSTAFILLLSSPEIDQDLVKHVNAFLTDDMSESLVLSTISVNLKTKSTLEQLSGTNKNLADSLYRLNVLYSTSSQFAGSLDKKKLINYMIVGLDKSLSFDLTCTLCIDAEPVLILNSLYEISDELLSAIKVRTVLNYKSLFEDKTPPLEIDVETLKVVKNVKYPANRFTFSLFQYDNMFAPISLGDNFFGCIEIFKEVSFTSDDATCFQTIAQQVSLPLKSATLYQEIKETNLKLEKLERLKSEFISIVSHELRTPLTAIKNSLDILISGNCGELNEAGSKFLSMAQRNVQRISGIINDLLDLSKIEAGKMDYHFANINIHSVIDYVKSSLSGLAKEKGLNLIAEETVDLPEIFADEHRLEQVLTNLVSNAIKFTPEGKNIIIRSHIADASQLTSNECFREDLKKLSGKYIVVCVEDQGIGIAEKDLLRAFDKFAQIENSLSRKVGGSGLGLPIAKQLLEAHQGTIWCDSEIDKGSKFYFAIPVAEAKVLTLN
ncbi:hybrid sensor histidine kinase/response regulator [bacterium]|nr:hybrid sensor histidine kinase/response regulator [bacterium]